VILVLENERDLAVLASLLGPFGRPMPGAKWDDDLDKWVVDEPPVQSDPGDENDWRDVAEWKPSVATAAYLEANAPKHNQCTCGASDGKCPPVGCTWAREQKRRQQAQMQSDHEPPHIPQLEGDDEIAALVRKVQDLNAVSLADAAHIGHAEYYASRAQ
jgi:hypothetical protein